MSNWDNFVEWLRTHNPTLHTQVQQEMERNPPPAADAPPAAAAERERRRTKKEEPSDSSDSSDDSSDDESSVPSESESEDGLERKPDRLAECWLFDGTQLDQWHDWKFFIIQRIARSCYRDQRTGRKALRIIGEALRGPALNYYMSMHPFKNVAHFFKSFESDHEILSMVDIALYNLDHMKYTGCIRVFTTPMPAKFRTR